MYTKQEIILNYYREGKGIRKISRELGLNRKTVTKYVDEYEELLKSGKSVEDAQVEYLARSPSYSVGVRPK